MAMDLYGNLDKAIAGLKYGLGAGDDIETGIAQEAIAFGAPVFGYAGTEDKVYASHSGKIVALLSADLVTSNVLTSTINGIAVATTFATDHATSMTAHIAAINAKAELIALGIVAASAGARSISVIGKALDVTFTQVVTLGASQATASYTASTGMVFLGIAMFTQKSTVDTGAGNSGYVSGEAVNIMRRGTIWVPVSVSVLDKEAAYVIFAATNQGKLTNSSSGTYDIGGYFRSNKITGDLAILEVRGLK
jgi:hypothetical protein